MPKPLARTFSRYTLEALSLLGTLIRLARTEKKMTAQELAERAGISRSLLSRMEKGDPGCQLGATFEVAAILGLRLFDSDLAGLSAQRQRAEGMLALLPKSVRKPDPVVNDDF